jgi:hypothetical protein
VGYLKRGFSGEQHIPERDDIRARRVAEANSFPPLLLALAAEAPAGLFFKGVLGPVFSGRGKPDA